jgi:uncharacterized protein
MAGIPVHDDQGTYDRPYDLTVRFEHAKIDKALAESGERPWRGTRPRVVPVLALHGFTGHYLLSAESKFGADHHASLSTAAIQYGVTLHIPTEAELAWWGVKLDRFPSPQGSSSTR